ncbi:MAG: tRNA (adenosine(37)-N6)-dimethylallyltransferase MiaA [Phycisphaerales bacterium]
MRLFPIICGPTASGKSSLAVEVAALLISRGTPAEVVTADAFQVYRGMDIGTAKPTLAERRGITHHLIDLVEPSEPFSVDQWLALAEPLIASLQARGTVPIVVGGTHLYVKALLEGLFEGPPPDSALRARLMDMDAHVRRAELERVDPAAAERIHFNDTRRTVRALEVFHQTGTPLSEHQGQWDSGKTRADALLVVLNRPVENLNPRINARVKAMLAAGLLDEIRSLVASGRLNPASQAAQALGYKQLLEHLAGGMSLDDATERIKIETRHFAKNQRTWLKRLGTSPDCLVFDASAEESSKIAQHVVNTILTAF